MEPQDVRARSPLPPPSRPTRAALEPHPTMLPMFVWRVGAATAVAVSFAMTAWQTLRLLDDEPWSMPIMLGTILAAMVAGAAVLVWTWCATENARRLVGPMGTVAPPDPMRNVVAWFVPFAFVALALGVVAVLGSRLEDSETAVRSGPLLVSVASLLLAIPLTYRPLYRLAAAVRQVGGYSARLSQWMWVPVVLALVGAATLVALRIGAVDDDGTDTAWAPLWVVAVVAIGPGVVVLALAWRAAEAVEEAITVAAARRRGRAPVRVKAARPGTPALRDRVTVVPGSDLLRLGVVSLVAGLALLSLVGAVVMGLFWLEGNDRELTPSQQQRAWDAMASLHEAARVVAFAVVVLVALWTAIAVLNVRRASGQPRNPVVAALAWPLAGVGIWAIADRFVVDQPAATVVAGLALQALVLYVPFALLERAAVAVDARRTPLRISYAFGVVLLVHIQGFGGLSTIEATPDSAEYLRLAGYLFLGALVQLLSTLAITDACRSLAGSTAHEAAHHNAIVDQRRQLARDAAT